MAKEDLDKTTDKGTAQEQAPKDGKSVGDRLSDARRNAEKAVSGLLAGAAILGATLGTPANAEAQTKKPQHHNKTPAASTTHHAPTKKAWPVTFRKRTEAPAPKETPHPTEEAKKTETPKPVETATATVTVTTDDKKVEAPKQEDPAIIKARLFKLYTKLDGQYQQNFIDNVNSGAAGFDQYDKSDIPKLDIAKKNYSRQHLGPLGLKLLGYEAPQAEKGAAPQQDDITIAPQSNTKIRVIGFDEYEKILNKRVEEAQHRLEQDTSGYNSATIFRSDTAQATLIASDNLRIANLTTLRDQVTAWHVQFNANMVYSPTANQDEFKAKIINLYDEGRVLAVAAAGELAVDDAKIQERNNKGKKGGKVEEPAVQYQVEFLPKMPGFAQKIINEHEKEVEKEALRQKNAKTTLPATSNPEIDTTWGQVSKDVRNLLDITHPLPKDAGKAGDIFSDDNKPDPVILRQREVNKWLGADGAAAAARAEGKETAMNAGLSSSAVAVADAQETTLPIQSYTSLVATRRADRSNDGRGA